MDFKIFFKKAPILKVIGALGTVAGAIVGLHSLLNWYEERTMDTISGRWELETITEKTSFKAFTNMHLGYIVYMQQKNNELHGTGEKAIENNIPIPPAGHTPIELIGVYDGETIKLTVVEKGKKRETRGMINLKQTGEKNKYVGTFSSTAANSCGKCYLKIIPDKEN